MSFMAFLLLVVFLVWALKSLGWLRSRSPWSVHRTEKTYGFTSWPFQFGYGVKIGLFPFLLLGLCLNPLRAQQAAEVMDLEQALSYARGHHPDLKKASLEDADARWRIEETRALGIPHLSANLGYQYFIDIPTQILPDFITPAVYGVLFQEGVIPPKNIETGDGLPAQFGTKHNLAAKLELQTMIVDGSYFIGLQAAQAYRSWVDQNAEVVREQVEKRVREAFLAVLLLNSNLQILDKNIKNIEALLQETRALYEEGFLEKLDVDRLSLSLATVKTRRDNLLRSKGQLLNALKLSMGYPVEEELEVKGDLQELWQAAAEDDLHGDISFAARPLYRQLQSSVHLNELNLRLQRSGYWPALYGFGSYSQSLLANKLSEGQWYPTTVVGLQLKIPIFDGLQKRAKVQRAKLQIEQLHLQMDVLEQAIYMEVENARINYQNALENWKSQKSNLELAEQIYNLSQIKYREGVGSSVELIQAEQQLHQNQQNVQQALYELVKAQMELRYALGK